MTPTSESHVNLMDLPIPINIFSWYQKDWGNHYLCSVYFYQFSWGHEVFWVLGVFYLLLCCCQVEQPIMKSNHRALLVWSFSVMSLILYGSSLIKYDKSDLGSLRGMFSYKWWKCLCCHKVFHLLLCEGIAGSFCMKNGSSGVLSKGWKMHVTAVSLVSQVELCQ